VGSPDEVCAKVAAYDQAGVDHLTALLFVGNTVEEMREQIRMFAQHVLPAFPDSSKRSDTRNSQATADWTFAPPARGEPCE
jgi:hypothetical protein